MYVNAVVTHPAERWLDTSPRMTHGRDLLSHFAVLSLIIASVVVVRVAVVPVKGITIKSIISDPPPKATPAAEAPTMKTAGKTIESIAAKTSEPAFG